MLGLILYHTITILGKKPFENIVGKGQNARNQHFLLFPQCLLPFLKQISIFQSRLFYRLQVFSIWTSLKNCCLVSLDRVYLTKTTERAAGRAESDQTEHVYRLIFLSFIFDLSKFLRYGRKCQVKNCVHFCGIRMELEFRLSDEI